MKREIVQSLLNILDPLGVIEVAPVDEYESEAKEICELLKDNKYSDIEYCIKSLYGNESSKNSKKIEVFIALLKDINGLWHK